MAAHQLPESLRPLAVPIASLHPYPRNPRQGDIGAISQSLSAHNQYRPVVVRRADNTVLAGNHTMAAAKALGWQEIAATFVDVDDDEAARIVLVDNRTADLASNNPEALAALLQELAATPAALQGTGYDGDALDELLADLGQMQPELAGDPDAVPEGPREPITQRGDLWVLAGHRLLCGDATSADDVRRLLAGAHPVLMVTDPPYGVSLDQGWRDRIGLNGLGRAQDDLMAGDGIVDWGEAFALADAGVAFVWHDGLYAGQVSDALARAGYEVKEQIVWVKTMAPLSRAYYHWKHEPCWFAVRRGHTVPWHVGRDQVTVWEAASPKHIMGGSEEEKLDHPTQKPVAIFALPIRNHTRRGEIVYDPFLGSGTALAAAEVEGRRCFGLEINPAYCDVIVQRWQDLTGKTAVREQIADDARVLSRA